jgi:7-cyano-7-deazaguanine reductase
VARRKVSQVSAAPVDLAERRSTRPTKALETFPNPSPGRDYQIQFECPEFTCVCPMTGQPDFAVMRITYVPDRLCVELKSLKLYLWSFRDEGAFHEAVTNRILDDPYRRHGTAPGRPRRVAQGLSMVAGLGSGSARPAGAIPRPCR